MRKLWLVLKREYLARVRTKAFVLSTISLPLAILAVFLFIGVMSKRQGEQTLKIAILDSAGGLAIPITQGLDEKFRTGKPVIHVVSTFSQPPAEEKVRDELRSQVRRGQLDGYVVVPREVLQGKGAEFHTRNPGDFALTALIRRALSGAIIARHLNDRGIHIENLTQLARGVDVTLVKITEQGETEERGQTILTAIVLVMVLYLSLPVYGGATMRSILEEKTTHVIEILMASVRPFPLLAGKILGVAAVGFTQLLIWTIAAGLLAGYGSTLAAALRPGATPTPWNLPTALLLYLLVFFLAGYFLYATLFAAVGAMVSTEEDAQQIALPVMLPLLMSVVLLTVILRNPSSTLSVVLSLIPFFSPVLMLLRIAIQMPPLWQIAVSLLLLVVTTLGFVYVSTRIYRVGALMYGKRPSLAEVFRWLRYT